MGLIDTPQKWIVKMFAMNANETGGENAAYFADGISMEQLDLADDESVFGQFQAAKTGYYFTQSALIVEGKSVLRIPYKSIVKTNGYLRSGHNQINIETHDQIHKIKVSELPYRIQQLLYQLIEKHGSPDVKPNFTGPNRLKGHGQEITDPNQHPSLRLDANAVAKGFTLDASSNLYCHGVFKERFLYPDADGSLAFEWRNGGQNIRLFDSETDGYNGFSERHIPRESIDRQWTKLDLGSAQLIIVFRYSISADEYPELKAELDLNDKQEMNDLFGAIELHFFKDGRMQLFSEYETQ